MTANIQGVPNTAVVPPIPYVSFSAEINPNSSEQLLGLCSQLATQGAPAIYLMLSTPGGSVMCGMNIYNVLRGLGTHLITHNVGNVDSIGNIVFLAGEKRYTCPHATFMFHGVGFEVPGGVRLEEKMLLERLDSIRADHNRLAAILAERTGITDQEARELFQQAQTRDPHYALEKGLVHDIRDVNRPAGAPFFQLVFQR